MLGRPGRHPGSSRDSDPRDRGEVTEMRAEMEMWESSTLENGTGMVLQQAVFCLGTWFGVGP